MSRPTRRELDQISRARSRSLGRLPGRSCPKAGARRVSVVQPAFEGTQRHRRARPFWAGELRCYPAGRSDSGRVPTGRALCSGLAGKCLEYPERNRTPPDRLLAMPVPHFEDKHAGRPYLTPHRLLAYRAEMGRGTTVLRRR
jgi:hypothetical protein